MFERLRRSESLAFAEIAFYRRIFTRALPGTRDFDWVGDIGCRNWTYLPAITESFAAAQIVGVEVTGAERLWNLRKRESQALSQVARAQALDCNVRLVTGDFRKWSGPVVAQNPLFLCLYPFVSEAPAQRWGLPPSFACFDEWLIQIRRLCPQGATVLTAHQGEWEADLARAAFVSAGVSTFQEYSVFPSEWANEGYPQRFEVRGFVARL